MPDKGFMSPEHLEEYTLSRMTEAMKEGVMKHSDIFNNDIYPKELRDFLIAIYETGWAEGIAATAKMMDDIQKVNGGTNV